MCVLRQAEVLSDHPWSAENSVADWLAVLAVCVLGHGHNLQGINGGEGCSGVDLHLAMTQRHAVRCQMHVMTNQWCCYILH